MTAGAAAPWIRTRAGRAPLAPSLPPPSLGESSTVIVGGLRPGTAVGLGPLVLEADAAGEVALRLSRSDLVGHVGLLPVSLDGRPAGELEIVPEKLTRDAYWRLRSDLEATWARLAYDPDGAVAARGRVPRAVDLWRRIAPAIEGIRRAPRSRLERGSSYGRLDHVRLPGSLRPAVLRAAARGGVARIEQIAATIDTPDNRLVRETLERLVRAAGRQPDGRAAADTAARFLRGEPFAHVGRVAGSTRPTHGVLRDARYRVVYQALRALDDPVSAVVEAPGDARLGLKGLCRLYEYWVFLQVLLAAQRDFGAPLGSYRAIAHRYGDRRARLDLPPGTTVEFPGRVRVAFEPAIRPSPSASWEGLELVPHPDPALAARLATPDVVVAVGDPPRLLVIDAKYVARAFVELEAASVHARYARMRHRGVPVVERVLVAHPHPGLSSQWAGYGHQPFVPGAPVPALAWPGRERRHLPFDRPDRDS